MGDIQDIETPLTRTISYKLLWTVKQHSTENNQMKPNHEQTEEQQTQINIKWKLRPI